MNAKIPLIFLSSIAVLMMGCSTPKPVLDLASQGVAITGKTEAELDEFSRRVHRLYVQRLESIKRLAVSDIEAKSITDFENYTAQRAGMTTEAGLIKLIRELADYRAQVRDAALKGQEKMEKSLAAGDPIKPPKEKLEELRKALAVLSQELTDKEWLEFSVKFGKQVNESRKEAKASADSAESKAAAK